MDKKICIWESRGTRCMDLKGHTHSVSALTVTQDSKYCLSASYDRTLRVWGLSGRRRGEEICVLKGHKAPILHMCFSGGMVCSGARDGVAMLWDLNMGTGGSR